MDITHSKKDYKAPRTRMVRMNVRNGILGESTGAVTIDDYTEETLVW